jgi:phosphate transport system protein
MRSKFDEQLALMKNELIQMGALCEEAISLAAKALTEGDKTLAEKVGPLDGEIDQMERDIESLCLKLLLQQQPVARDLRQISAALKIITDMERIGDQASDIAEIILAMLSEGYVPEDVGHIREMAQETIKMVTESVDSYVQQDIERARAVIAHDDTIDRYFTQVKAVLIQKIAEAPAVGEHALDLLMIDKYLERIGDHAVNIAEWVIFSVTGNKNMQAH